MSDLTVNLTAEEKGLLVRVRNAVFGETRGRGPPHPLFAGAGQSLQRREQVIRNLLAKLEQPAA